MSGSLRRRTRSAGVAGVTGDSVAERQVVELRCLASSGPLVAAASAKPLMSAETLRRVRKRQRRYLSLFERVAGMNALLLIAAVAVTIVVLAPHKSSSLAINEEVVVLVARWRWSCLSTCICCGVSSARCRR